jgi:ABC-type proline/glycine betaine transport system ATPase subunit
LRHARQHCAILVDTSDLTADEVERRVRAALSGGQSPNVGV